MLVKTGGSNRQSRKGKIALVTGEHRPGHRPQHRCPVAWGRRRRGAHVLDKSKEGAEEALAEGRGRFRKARGHLFVRRRRRLRSRSVRGPSRRPSRASAGWTCWSAMPGWRSEGRRNGEVTGGGLHDPTAGIDEHQPLKAVRFFRSFHSVQWSITTCAKAEGGLRDHQHQLRSTRGSPRSPTCSVVLRASGGASACYAHCSCFPLRGTGSPLLFFTLYLGASETEINRRSAQAITRQAVAAGRPDPLGRQGKPRN